MTYDHMHYYNVRSCSAIAGIIHSLDDYVHYNEYGNRAMAIR